VAAVAALAAHLELLLEVLALTRLPAPKVILEHQVALAQLQAVVVAVLEEQVAAHQISLAVLELLGHIPD
jgi:hypothetical protein